MQVKYIKELEVIMNKEDLSADSPCMGICTLHKINNETLCSGCKRRPDEIRNWVKFTDKEKIEINKNLKTR